MKGKYVVIQPDGVIELLEDELDEDGFPPLKVMQDHVGGFIEHVVVSFKGKRVDAFVNEEGKLQDLDFNLKATAVYHNSMPYRKDDQYDDFDKAPEDYIDAGGDAIMGPMILMFNWNA
jgi:hypothetical protein